MCTRSCVSLGNPLPAARPVRCLPARKTPSLLLLFWHGHLYQSYLLRILASLLPALYTLLSTSECALCRHKLPYLQTLLLWRYADCRALYLRWLRIVCTHAQLVLIRFV